MRNQPLSDEVLASTTQISAAIVLEQPLPGWSRGDYRYLHIEYSEEGHRIFTDRLLEPSDIKVVRTYSGSGASIWKNGGGPNASTFYTVSISGSIEFDDSWQFERKGLYGNTVQLWFRDSNDPDPYNWYHPVASGDCFGIQFTHYDILDVNGDYNFNFSFTGDLTAYNEALVIVSRDNSSIRMPVQPDGIQIYCNPIPTNWFSLSESVQIPIDGANPNITASNADVLVNGLDGAIFRNMMFAHEALVQRHGGSVPYPMPQIYLERVDIPNYAGLFISSPSSDPYIQIDHSWTDASTTTHEYGHYVNYQAQGGFDNYSANNTEAKEGWAVFYSMVARNYGHKTYDDDLRQFDDEGEVSPFTTNPRFAYIRYTSTNPLISAYACYLWNINDNYYDGPLESINYVGDNDDIYQQDVLIFNIYAYNIIYSPAIFHGVMLTAVSSALQPSVQDAWDFMYESPSMLMRSAQVNTIGLSTTSSTEIVFSWETPYYDDPSPLDDAINPPDEYRVYRDVGGAWNLDATAPYGQNSATVTSPDPRGDYKITANNSSGDSYGAPEVSVLGLTLSTAQYIESGSGGTYKVDGDPVGSSWPGYAISGETIEIEAVPPTGWNLLEWSDGSGANPRQLTPTSETSLYAVYKKHLASSSISVTATNSQRKIVRDIYDDYHLAYESVDKIWYSRSTDGGNNWSTEKSFGDLPSGYKFRSPSITVQHDPHLILIVYEQYSTSGTDHIINCTTIDPSSGVILSNVAIWAGANTTFDTNPVVASGIGNQTLAPTESYCIALWSDGGTGFMYASVRDGSSGLWSTNAFQLTSEVVSDISIAPISPALGDPWEVVWIVDKDLYYSSIDVDNSPSLNSPTNVIAFGSSDVENLNPSAANLISTNGQPGVAWEEYTWEIQKRVIKYKESKNWTQTKVWSASPSTDFYTPTLAGTPNSSDLSIIWRAGSSTLKYVQREAGSWSSVASLASGTDPVASVGWNYSSTEKVLSRNNSSPYSIQQNEVSFQQQAPLGPKQGNPITGNGFGGRGGRMIFEEGEMRLVVLSASLNDTPITFEALNDTIPIRSLEKFEASLRTEPLTGTGTLDIDLLYTASGTIPGDGKFGATIRDAQTDQILALLRSFDGVSDTVMNFQVPFNYRTRSVILSLFPIDITGVKEFEVEEWYIDSGEELNMASLIREEIPASYALHQNYPNPFNPTTTIKYDLPEDSHVNLKIYDILGKEVLTLMDDYRQAGYHQTHFAANRLASGMYFYRLTAGEFIDVKKMLLVK